MTKPKDRQTLLIILCWAIYTSAYFGRYSYSSNINLIMSDYGIGHAEAGLVTTFFFFGYGAGQLIHGLLCEKYDRKIVFPLVLFSSAMINTAVFFKFPFQWIKFLWLLNAAMQSALWPTLIDMIGRYLDPQHKKRAIFVMSTTTPIGTLLTYCGSSLFVMLGQYRLSFLIGACFMGAIGILWLIFYRKVRELPVQVSGQNDQIEENVETPKKFRNVILTTVITLCVFAVIHNFIKDGLQTWVPSILKEESGLSDSLSIFLSLLLPLLGVFGSLLSLTIEKKLHDLVWNSMILMGTAVPLLFFVVRELRASAVVTLILFGAVVLLMHAINNTVTSMAPLLLKTNVNSGRLAGIFNASCYIGSTASSYLLGIVSDRYGWNIVMYLFIGAAVFAILFGMISKTAQRIISKKNENCST